MNKLNIVLIGILLFVSTVVSAQELRCNVSVSAAQIENANRNVFQTLQADLYEFMNNRKWTDHVYSQEEKIECNIFIQLNDRISTDEYSGSMTVQLTRPTYNSTYESPILNIKDNDVQFTYEEYQTLEFNENSNTENLTSLMAYYAYIILGMDYDSFSQEGGTEYFQKAQQIVNNMQNAREPGWKAYESENNRYWLVENILNNAYSPYRECIYRYHRLGLDLMSDQVVDGRAEVAESLRLIQRVFRNRPSLYILQLFFDAKSTELVNIFSESYPDEQNRVLAILKEVDPSNASKYERISENSVFEQ